MKQTEGTNFTQKLLVIFDYPYQFFEKKILFLQSRISLICQ